VASLAVTLPLLLTLGRQTVRAWIDDDVPSMGAALAYYTLFSLAPLLLIVIAVAGLVFGPDAARGEIFGQLHGLIGDAGAAAVQQLLESVSKPAGGLLAASTGLVAMLVGATTVFAELQSAFDRIWRAPRRPDTGWWGLVRARVLSFGLILGVGFLLLVSLVVSAGIAALQAWWAPWFPAWAGGLLAVNMATGLLLLTLMFAMIFKVMPRVRIAWADVWVGALATALLFTGGRALIAAYLARSAVTSGFGAAGSLVLLLVWVYYSAQIFLLGAEFTWVYAHALGSRRGTPLPVAQRDA
jgi:membrane protein